MKGKIYHICEDEKFINSAIQQFEEVFPNQNVFIVVKDDKAKLKHVKDHFSVREVNYESLLLLKNEVEFSDLVIFHSLAVAFYEFVLQLPKKIQTIWVCFGFEVYGDSKYFDESSLLAPITQREFPNILNKKTLKKEIKDVLRPYARVLKPKVGYTAVEMKQKAFKRINYLGSSFLEEYQSVTAMIKLEKKFFPFWYYPLELIVDVKDSIHLSKPNILIGNSGFKSGNHLDVFEQLKETTLSGAKIVVPLNYGTQSYIDKIVEEGKTIFRDRFEPLLEFMPLADYNEILKEIGVAILYTKRQQAVGNTIALLWFGAKVFLSKNNPFYPFLKRNGVAIFSVEEDLRKPNALESLTLSQMESNRTILYSLLNQEKLATELQREVEKIYE